MASEGALRLLKRGEMLKITVASIGILQEFLNSRGIEVEIEEPAKIGDLIDLLAGRWGDEFYRKIIQEGELNPYVIILLNGLAIKMKQGVDTELNDGDRVVFTTMFTGG